MEETALARMVSRQHTKFYKSTFEKISEDKRQRILDVAISEFAQNGYNATNINVLAKKADISIGSMYSYFESKEALFLTIVDKGFHLLETALDSINSDNGDVFEILEKLLKASRDYALSYPELNQIYLDLTTQGLSALSGKLSKQMESITAKFYCEALRNAMKKGIIRQDLDEHLTSFFLDNLIVMFQFSFTSDYYRQRMHIFLGSKVQDDGEEIIKGLVEFARRGLS